MRAIDIDYAKSTQPGRWAAWLLLLAGLACVAEVALLYIETSSNVADMETRLARLSRRADLQQAVRSEPPEELAAARAVVRRFATPWPALFRAVESVQLDDVALLSIEPDPQSGTVLINAEASDYLAALTYTTQLAAQRGLSKVHLARHELRPKTSRRPLAFTVSANWGKP